MQYIAHKNKTSLQGILEHSTGVAELSALFASKFNSKDFGYLAGYYHDVGKYSKAFYKRLFENGKKIDHATAGARVLFNKDNVKGKLLSYAIAGHHGGLPDWIYENSEEASLIYRLKNKKLEDFSEYKNELNDFSLDDLRLLIKPGKDLGFSVSFYVRMLFSCLVDADFLDTERFMDIDKFLKRKNGDDIQTLYKKLENKLKTFKNPVNEIGKIRNDILNNCIKASDKQKGFFSLTVPTGGGKTISSIAFALKHCIKNNMDRVIYAIPYTSIIEQNAEVFKNIFGTENVLEHHSNYDFDNPEDDDEIISYYKKLASENWDMPIIVSTNVQFFESLFSSKTSKCRKLHNIANSVIILDEVQMLPVEYLEPCILALKELVANYNCTIVLCSATQSLTDIKMQDKIKIDDIYEIIDNPKLLCKKLKRTEIENIGRIEDIKLAENIKQYESVLCVVNTKKHARNLHQMIENSYHLSTYMCPIHRKETIYEIKEKLKSNLSVKVISTQLIEAGVDLDFPVVFRSIAGIDSIVQAAGRCNREGKLEKGQVFVFQSEEKFAIPKGFLSRCATSTITVANKHKDLSSLDAIKDYFNNLYNIETDFDIKKILSDLDKQDFNFSFKSAANKFKFIENNTVSLIIPYNSEAKNLIEKLENEFDINILRQLSQYTINLYENEILKLKERGVIKSLNLIKDILILSDDSFYDENFGIKIPQEDEVLMI